MNALQIGTLRIVFAGVFGEVNHIVFRLPSAIGILIVALAASFCALGLDALRPDLGVAMEMRQFVTEAELSRTLNKGILGIFCSLGPTTSAWRILTVIFILSSCSRSSFKGSRSRLWPDF
jgi:CPA1 family monovalent cation:H+ antiporter